MHSLARETHRTSMALATAALLLAGCEWEVEPASSVQGLEREACDLTTRASVPACEVPFLARVWGECNDCTDRGCRLPEPGGPECVCHAQREVCWQLDTQVLPDGGVEGGERCTIRATKCECGDGSGAIYDCECEGGGGGDPDECQCQVPRDTTFDPEFECGL